MFEKQEKKGRVIEVPFSLTSCCTWSYFLTLIYSVTSKGDSRMMPNDPLVFFRSVGEGPVNQKSFKQRCFMINYYSLKGPIR